jgi:crotonobetainyl-CoA:carnitine CoA-transferase CaiB-like acyl-CoA transferase
MTKVMQGVRVLEVAEHTFVPAASALLADWGAAVIKIEHVERGDAMRGILSSGTTQMLGDVNVLLEHSNRGKQSLGLDLTSPDGLDILGRIAATCDVFLTNKLPGVQEKLHITVDEIRAANPQIIYVRGTGQGSHGPDADKGSYDSLAFWARSGVQMGAFRPEFGDLVPTPPGPGFGDSIGAMTIAGGIMGALYHRERTGEATVVDVSLLGTGMWALGQALALSLLTGQPWQAPPRDAMNNNPLVAYYRTQDDRWIALCCLQAAKYWPPFCETVLQRPELVTDERFCDHASLFANAQPAKAILEEEFAQRPLAEWRDRLDSFVGQWTVVQHTLEVAADPQTIANGYVQEMVTADGVKLQLAAAPVQFDDESPVPGRAPEFNEHGDEILASIGLDWDTIIDLKVRGVVA